MERVCWIQNIKGNSVVLLALVKQQPVQKKWAMILSIVKDKRNSCVAGLTCLTPNISWGHGFWAWILPSLKNENFCRTYNVSRTASCASIKKLCVFVVCGCADPTIHWLWNESCSTRPWQRHHPSWSQSQVVFLGFQESSMPCCHFKFTLVGSHSHPPVAVAGLIPGV